MAAPTAAAWAAAAMVAVAVAVEAEATGAAVVVGAAAVWAAVAEGKVGEVRAAVVAAVMVTGAAAAAAARAERAAEVSAEVSAVLVAEALGQMGFVDPELVQFVVERNGPDLDACVRDLATLNEVRAVPSPPTGLVYGHPLAPPSGSKQRSTRTGGAAARGGCASRWR